MPPSAAWLMSFGVRIGFFKVKIVIGWLPKSNAFHRPTFGKECHSEGEWPTRVGSR